jgi:hypothetical protein
VAAGFVAVVWLLGFLASKAYSVMFLTEDFADESPLDWLEIGLRTLPLPVYLMLWALIISVAVGFIWRLTTAVSPALGRWSEQTSRRFAGAMARGGLTREGSLPTVVLLLQVLALAGVYWTFHDLIIAILTPIRVETVVEHAHLAHSYVNEWLMFGTVTSLLALASGLAWAAIIRRRRSGERGLAAITAGIALTGMFVAMYPITWRIYQQSAFQTVTYNSAQCFIVGERDARVLLICPALAAPDRSPIVNVDDPKLDKPKISQPLNIFDAVAHDRLQGDR